MTQEEAGRFWPIIKAYSEGKQIEIKESECVWSDIEHPNFDSYFGNYRVKKEPVCRPFGNADECWEEMKKHDPFGWVKSSSGVLFNIFEIGKSYIVIAQSGVIEYDKAINVFSFADGTPFGKREE